MLISLFRPSKKAILKKEIDDLVRKLQIMHFKYELEIPLMSLIETDNNKFLDWAIEQNKAITTNQNLLAEKMKELAKYEKG